MKLKITSILLSFALIFALAACRSNKTNNSPEKATSTTAEAASTTKKQETTNPATTKAEATTAAPTTVALTTEATTTAVTTTEAPTTAAPTTEPPTEKTVYLDVKGKDIFNAVIAGENPSYNDNYGDSEWYTWVADINGISFEVDSEGKDGKALIVQIIDLMNTGKTDIYYKLINTVFSGDDLSTATSWLKNNIGKTASTKIGDANLVLRLSVTNYPILYVVDDEHMDWI